VSRGLLEGQLFQKGLLSGAAPVVKGSKTFPLSWDLGDSDSFCSTQRDSAIKSICAYSKLPNPSGRLPSRTNLALDN
jgi:hypothetical protein